MRSRYSAYALGGHADYLVQSWHPADAGAISAADLEAGDMSWEGLEIISAEQQGERAMVEFRARFREGNGPVQVHHERSLFLRHRGQWYYLSGEVATEDP